MRAVAARAFTLLDLLVSIAVIAILMGLMLPVVSHVTEATRRVTCRSNVRQIGLALSMYADENHDHLPASIYTAVPQPGSFLPQQLTQLHVEQNGAQAWDGLGYLFVRDYLPTAEIFYCPSHKGMHTFSAFEDEWRSRTGAILGNYHLRALMPTQNYLHAVSPHTALVADAMRELADVNHRHGCNLLRADISVEWFEDDHDMLLGLIPAACTAPGSDLRVARAWWTLETGSPSDFQSPPWANPGATGNGQPRMGAIP